MKKYFIIALMMAFAFIANAGSPDPGRAYGTHWSFQTNYENNITFTGVIVLDGESLQDSPRSLNLEIGAFCGNECRGSYVADHITLPFFNGYAYQMQIYSNEVSGDLITFRVYDHEAEAELDVTCLTEIEFVANQSFGNLRNPYEIEFVSAESFPIIATAVPAEGGTITGAGGYHEGDTCTLTATANIGYTFQNWTKDGTIVTTEPTYSFVVTEAASFEANFSINSYEITASANPTEGGTVEGGGTFNHGTTCTLTATANEGYTFTNWTKNGEAVSTEAEYSFTVTGAGDYVANFTLNSYQITVAANPTEGGTVEGAGTFNHGTTCTLTATANEGYTFTNWTKNGQVVSTEAEYSFTVTAAGDYVANFTLNSYQITVTANPTEGGTVTGGGTYDHGTTCTLTATVNEGYTFANWTKNGQVVSTEAEYSFTVTAAGDYVANFNIITYQITASANPTEGGTVEGAGTYNHGTTCTLTATANEGYTFVNWTKNGEVVSTETEYSFTVTAAGDYVANFNINSYEITASANPIEGGTVSEGGTFNHGETCTLVATPNELYTFVNWTKNGVVVSTQATYTFTVTSAGNYVANFALGSYEITAAANPTAGGTVTGAGEYYHFATCTLTATANEGYTFINWTKNGEVVSTEAEYSFTVTGAGDYVANFSINTYEITATAIPAEGGNVSGAGTFDYGTTCTLVATANEGYTFINWTKDGSIVSTNASYSFTVTAAGNYVANFTLNSYDIIVVANPAEGGTVTGGGTYNHFESCTLTATVNEDYTFINWTKNGAVVSTELEFEFTVTEGGTYVANFTPNQFTISVSANPTSGGSVNGGGVYDAGASCTLTATPSYGYTFINWTKNGTVVSTNSTYSFIVNENASYVAHFSHQSYEITATADPATGGSVSGAGTYYYGSICTLTATANNGYNFTGWTKNGNVVSYNPTYSFAVTENAAYVAHFSTSMYLITLSADPAEGGSVYGTGAYTYGDECTILATTNPGYTFVNWTKNGTVVSTSSNYTFTVTENAEYVAHYSFNSYVITASANPEIGGTVTGGGTYAHGTTCNLVATPNEGYSFVNWTKNGNVVSTQANYSFTVTEGGLYVANFEVSTYVITVTPEPAEGGIAYGSGTYQYGAPCTLRATANEGYTFAYWSKDGVQVSTNPIYYIVVRENASFKAHFEAESFEITATVTPQGSGIINGAGSYNYGETCTLTVTPNNDYVFINWTENGEVVSEEETFEFIVTDNHHFVANLEYVEGVDENNGITFGVYPNPVINMLTVEISEPVDLFEIYTITGEIVYKQADCSEKIVIDVHDLSNGIYMIRLTNGNSIATQRFVKSR